MTLSDWVQERRQRRQRRREAAQRRREVSNSGIYYCQLCGNRKAKLMSGGMLTQGAAFCSDACSSGFAGILFRRGGWEVIEDEVIGAGFGNSLSGFGTRKYCKWCGARIAFDATSCSECGGQQEKRTSPA